jgi:uncharacterized protein
MPPAALAFAAAVGSAFVANRVAASRRAGLRVTWHRVPWNGTRRVRVVHLTDIHVGPTTPRAVLDRVIDVVTTLECDVVAMTGDYVNTSLFFLDRVTDFVRALPKPCVATLGNHDHWTNADRVSRALEAGGARVLRNASTVLERDGAELVVVGVDDGRSGHADVERAFERVEEPARALVLSHFPNTANEIARTGAPLVLSGHTHAGQIDVPRATALLAKLSGNPYLHGFHRAGASTHVYVSAGIGHSFPGMRAGQTCPELAVFELDPAARTRRSCTLRTAWSGTPWSHHVRRAPRS